MIIILLLLDFAEETVDLLWLDNSDSEDILIFKEAYRDNRNSPYSIVDRVETEVTTNNQSASGSYNERILHQKYWTYMSEHAQ